MLWLSSEKLYQEVKKQENYSEMKKRSFWKSFEKVKLVLVNIRFKLDISMPVMVTNPGIGFGAWHLLFLLHGKIMLLQSLTFYNAPRSWAIDNGSNSGLFTTQGNLNLQWRGFILDDLAFSEKILDSGHCPPWCRVPATCYKFYLCTFTWRSY